MLSLCSWRCRAHAPWACCAGRQNKPRMQVLSQSLRGRACRICRLYTPPLTTAVCHSFVLFICPHARHSCALYLDRTPLAASSVGGTCTTKPNTADRYTCYSFDRDEDEGSASCRGKECPARKPRELCALSGYTAAQCCGVSFPGVSRAPQIGLHCCRPVYIVAARCCHVLCEISSAPRSRCRTLTAMAILLFLIPGNRDACFEVNIDYPGNDLLGSPFDVPTAQDCQQLCKNNGQFTL